MGGGVYGAGCGWKALILMLLLTYDYVVHVHHVCAPQLGHIQQPRQLSATVAATHALAHADHAHWSSHVQLWRSWWLDGRSMVKVKLEKPKVPCPLPPLSPPSARNWRSVAKRLGDTLAAESHMPWRLLALDLRCVPVWGIGAADGGGGGGRKAMCVGGV